MSRGRRGDASARGRPGTPSRLACGQTTTAGRPRPWRSRPRARQRHALASGRAGASRSPDTTTARSRPPRSTTSRARRPPSRPRRTERPDAWWRPGTSAARSPGRGRSTWPERLTASRQPPGARHVEPGPGPARRCAGATRRAITAPSTSTTTTCDCGWPPTSPTPCPTASGAACTRCGCARATSRT